CMENNSNVFGSRLKQLRRNAGFTQSSLGEQLDRSASTVRMWEFGANEPDMKTLVLLSTIFDCSLDYLLCRDIFSPKSASLTLDIPVYRLSAYGADAQPEGSRSISPDYLLNNFSYIALRNDCYALPQVPLDSVVLVRLQDASLDRQIVFAKYRGEYMLRRLFFCDAGLILATGGDDASPVFVGMDDALEIIGVAVESTLTL
ncbi:MAG: helix-turn-helix transcriptional regulator, partial [Clostridia bacterium]|nr:helix-turn-helix transcriptional regulator [Clostridia bacterium]